MSMKLYDQALTDKIQKWMPELKIGIYSPDDTSNLFRIVADNNNDKPIKLPLVCIRRNGGYNITNTTKQPLAYDGATLEATALKSIQLNAIPIRLDYQIDIYTKYLEEADELCRNFIFNLINYPKVSVVVPYNDYNCVHDSSIALSTEVQDNSDIPERLIKGQFTRLTISLNIPDAYLFDVKVRDNYLLDVSVDAN